MFHKVMAVAGVLIAAAFPASAQDYPSKPLTMVIPFAAGGPVDVLGRILAQRMGEVLSQQVIVENVTGAGGMTGGYRVAQSPPDGYSSSSAASAPTRTIRRSTRSRCTM